MKTNDYLKKMAVLVTFLTISLFAMNVQANARLIVTNPGENSRNEMRINWHTDTGVSGSFVEFTKRTDTEWANTTRVYGEYVVSSTWNGVLAGTRPVPGGPVVNVLQDFDVNRYRVTLSGLTPGTEYKFRVVADGNVSDPRRFRTAGTGDFSFAWISDIHAYQPLPQRLTAGMNMVSRLITAAGPAGVDFILSTGDILAYGGCYSEWYALFNHENLRNHAYVSLIGNHDVYRAGPDGTAVFNHKHAFFTDTHNKPPNGYEGDIGNSYWFMHNNVLWIVLNSMDLANTARVPIAQAWAEQVILNNPAQYIFFAQHFQWFNGSGAPAAAGFSRWHAFFDRHGVDLALAGNDHVYVRTHSIYNGQVNNDPSRGTVFINAPSSDNDRGRAMPALTGTNPERIAYRWTEGGPTVGGLLVTVTETHIEVNLYDRNGIRRDHAIIPARRTLASLQVPRVTHVLPENLNKIVPRRPLKVNFSLPMDRSSVEQAINTVPAVPISFSWDNDNTLLINLSQLDYETAYKLTIDGSIAKSTTTGHFLAGDGSEEGSDFVLNFTTVEQDLLIPVIVSYDPQGAQEESIRPIVRIEFNKPLNQATIAPIIVTDSYGNMIDGTQTYHEVNGRSVVHFIFDADLMALETYTVILADGIECHNGNEMVGGLEFDFTVRPRVVSHATMVQPFTSIAGWTNGSQTNGHVSAMHLLDANTVPRDGVTASLRMNYQWEEHTTSTTSPPRRWRLHNGTANTQLTSFSRADHNVLQFYLFGDGSHTRFTVVLQRQVITANNTFYGRWVEMDWVGWRRITWDLTDDTGLTYPWLGGSGGLPEIDPMVVKGLNTEASTAGNQTWNPSSFWVSSIQALQVGEKVDFIVTFNSQGGTEVSPVFLSDGDKVPRPENPVRRGHYFAGWFRDAAGTQAWDFDNDIVTENLTLFAKWEAGERPYNFPHPEQDDHVVAQEFYTFFHHRTADAPWLNEINIRRVLHRDGKLYILTQAPNPEILIKDAETLELIRKMDLTGVSGGLNGVTLSDIAFTADGKLLACNLAVVSSTVRAENTTGAPRFKVYIWDNDDAQPRIFYELYRNTLGLPLHDSGPDQPHEVMLGNWGNGFWFAGRLGETMAVSGPSWDTKIYMPAFSANEATGVGETFRMVAHHVKDGVLVETQYRMRIGIPEVAASHQPFGAGFNFGGSGNFQLMVSPLADNRFIFTSNASNPTEFEWNWNDEQRATLQQTGYLALSANSLQMPFRVFNANYFRYAGRAYMAAAMASSGRIFPSVALLDITDGLNDAKKISDHLVPEFPNYVSSYMKAFGVVNNEHIYLSVLGANLGLATFATYQPVWIDSPIVGLELRVYPNPVQNTLNIDADFEIRSLRLVDVLGRTVKNIPANQTSIDMSNIQSGNYILFVNEVPVRIIKR